MDEERLERERQEDDAPGADAVRARLLERFDAWLRQVLADEEPPSGVAAELLRELEPGDESAAGDDRGNWFSLWSAMTALTQEVKLQGRAFGRLNESISPFPDIGSALADSLAAHRQSLDVVHTTVHDALTATDKREAEAARKADRQASRKLLDVLLDVRDRLARGLGLARRHADDLSKPRRWRALFGLGRKSKERAQEVTAALERGYVLALERLQEALDRLGVREIECAGQRFDPNTMTAADVQETAEVADGTVLGVYRSGYEWKGETLRPAQVNVARSRRPLAKEPDDEPS